MVQPLAGPLRRPSDGGLRIVSDGDGTLRLRVRVPGLGEPLEALVLGLTTVVFRSHGLECINPED